MFVVCFVLTCPIATLGSYLSLTLPLSLKEADTNVHAVVEDILKEHDTTKVLPYCLRDFGFI